MQVEVMWFPCIFLYVMFLSCKWAFWATLVILTWCFCLWLIRETKTKPKNNSLLDLYYPWITDRFSLILLATSEHIKSKSCVWSAEHSFLSSLPRLSKLAQRTGSSTAPEIPPLLGLGTQSQEFLKWGGMHQGSLWPLAILQEMEQAWRAYVCFH